MMTGSMSGPARRVALAYHAGQGQDERAMGEEVGALRASIYEAPRGLDLAW